MPLASDGDDLELRDRNSGCSEQRRRVSTRTAPSATTSSRGDRQAVGGGSCSRRSPCPARRHSHGDHRSPETGRAPFQAAFLPWASAACRDGRQWMSWISLTDMVAAIARSAFRNGRAPKAGEPGGAESRDERQNSRGQLPPACCTDRQFFSVFAVRDALRIRRDGREHGAGEPARAAAPPARRGIPVSTPGARRRRVPGGIALGADVCDAWPKTHSGPSFAVESRLGPRRRHATSLTIPSTTRSSAQSIAGHAAGRGGGCRRA